MLAELAVRGWGLIDDLSLVLGPGMTALTGETGAGKTMVTGALAVLAGGRADPALVRSGVDEAVIEGRFLLDDDERVLARVVPRNGRSRAYVDGRLATAGALAEAAADLLELHAQHGHVALMAAATQRAALDRFAAIDLDDLHEARVRVATADAAIAALGGEAVDRAREVDLLQHQLRELEEAGLEDPDEVVRLVAEEDLLADAEAHLEALAAAQAALTTDGGASDALALARAALGTRLPFADAAARLDSVAAELADVAAGLRTIADIVEADPARLAEVQARRSQLAELRRRHLDGPLHSSDLAGLIAKRDELRRRLDETLRRDELVAQAEEDRRVAIALEREAAAAVAAARRAAAAPLEAAVGARLAELAMAGARFQVDVAGADPADDVTFLLAANPGEPAAPVSRGVSGGELARVMLALRLVLGGATRTVVFDEVDAGVGGRAARAVGRFLAELATDRQVLVVTHLPQVAAFADLQVALTKATTNGATVVQARPLDDDERLVELSRMLSGLPTSGSGREHAEELLATAAQERGR